MAGRSYSLVELRDGTGFRPGARFVEVEPDEVFETPDEFRRRVEASTVDPEDHDYQGDGTSRCPVCLGQMNEHLPTDRHRLRWDKP